MAKHQPRVLFIGLDALDPDLTLQWAREGVLPAFASLMEKSVHGPAINPPGLYVGAVWPSFFTGASPTRHGRYCYEQIVPGSYHLQRFRPSHLRRQPFWKQLSDAKRRVAVIDVPKSALESELNGIQVQDWGTHDPETYDAVRTCPPDLAAELTARYGSDPVGDCNRIDRSAEGIAAFCQNLKARIETKTAMCGELLEREDWDLFLAVFAESHCIGHQCWTVHDQTHASHDREIARAVGDPLKEIYIALDGALARLLEKSGAQTHVFVLASHGMGPHYDATFMLDQILDALDPQPGARKRRLIRSCRRYSRAVIKRVLQRRLPPLPPPVEHRRCFSIPNNDVHGGIRVNLAGREPRGRVHAGKEYDELFHELRRDLMELTNADTGQPVVRNLVRAGDLYPGEPLDELPDFFVEWNRETPISSVSSPKFGTLSKTFNGVRTGDHKPEGFFWAAGPNIAEGKSIAPVSIMDFAPTVATLLDVSLNEIDGKPIAAILV